MKLKVALLSLLATSSLAINAQDSNYKLDSYVNPTFQRKALDLEFGSLGSFSKLASGRNYEARNYFQGNLLGNYSQIANSQYLQQTTNIKLGLGGVSRKLSSKEGRYRDEERNKEFSFDLNVSHSSLFYNDDNHFIELGSSTYFKNLYQSSAGYDREGFPLTISNQGPSFDVSIKLGVGTGRIENVTDARHAIYIVAELEKKGLLKRTLSNDEVNELAQLITTLKNKRHFDSRTKLAEEIEAVDAYLIENGFVEEAHSAVYFTSLYDKWMYGDRDMRQAGSRFKVGVSPLFTFNDLHQKNRRTYYTDRFLAISASYGAGIYADYTNEKPLSLKLQQSIFTNLSTDWVRARYSRTSLNTTYHNELDTKLSLGYSLSYYLNTRTYLVGGVSEYLRWLKTSKGTRGIKNNDLESFTNLYVKGYYYVSPQLRLFGECNFLYSFDRDMKNNVNEYNKFPTAMFALGFSYAIF